MRIKKQRIIDHYMPSLYEARPKVAPTHIFTKQLYPDYDYTNFHKEWQQIVRNNRRALIIAPVTSSKTSMITQEYSLESIYRDPELRILVVSSTADQAHSINMEARGKITGELAQYYGNLKAGAGQVWNTKQLTIKWRRGHYREPNITYIGVGTKVAGLHFHIIILDDIINIENSSTPAQREALKKWIRLAVLSRLIAGGQVIVIGTRFHPDDYLGDLLREDNDYVTNSYHAAYLEDGSSYWPKIWTLDFLKSKEKEMGKAIFAASYLNDPRGMIGNVAYDLNMITFLNKEEMPETKDCAFCIGSIDAGRTDSESSDYTVLQVWGYQQFENTSRHTWADFLNRKYFMLNQYRARVSHTGIINFVSKVVNEMGITTWVIESCFEENILYRRLTNVFPRLNIIPIRPTSRGKLMRMLDVEAVFAAGLVTILNDNELKRELYAFPNGEHDDQCDAMNMAIKYLKHHSSAKPINFNTLYANERSLHGSLNIEY